MDLHNNINKIQNETISVIRFLILIKFNIIPLTYNEYQDISKDKNWLSIYIDTFKNFITSKGESIENCKKNEVSDSYRLTRFEDIYDLLLKYNIPIEGFKELFNTDSVNGIKNFNIKKKFNNIPLGSNTSAYHAEGFIFSVANIDSHKILKISKNDEENVIAYLDENDIFKSKDNDSINFRNWQIYETIDESLVFSSYQKLKIRVVLDIEEIDINFEKEYLYNRSLNGKIDLGSDYGDKDFSLVCKLILLDEFGNNGFINNPYYFNNNDCIKFKIDLKNSKYDSKNNILKLVSTNNFINNYSIYNNFYLYSDEIYLKLFFREDPFENNSFEYDENFLNIDGNENPFYGKVIWYLVDKQGNFIYHNENYNNFKNDSTEYLSANVWCDAVNILDTILFCNYNDRLPENYIYSKLNQNRITLPLHKTVNMSHQKFQQYFDYKKMFIKGIFDLYSETIVLEKEYLSRLYIQENITSLDFADMEITYLYIHYNLLYDQINYNNILEADLKLYSKWPSISFTPNINQNPDILSIIETNIKKDFFPLKNLEEHDKINLDIVYYLKLERINYKGKLSPCNWINLETSCINSVIITDDFGNNIKLNTIKIINNSILVLCLDEEKEQPESFNLSFGNKIPDELRFSVFHTINESYCASYKIYIKVNDENLYFLNGEYVIKKLFNKNLREISPYIISADFINKYSKLSNISLWKTFINSKNCKLSLNTIYLLNKHLWFKCQEQTFKIYFKPKTNFNILYNISLYIHNFYTPISKPILNEKNNYRLPEINCKLKINDNNYLKNSLNNVKYKAILSTTLSPLPTKLINNIAINIIPDCIDNIVSCIPNNDLNLTFYTISNIPNIYFNCLNLETDFYVEKSKNHEIQIINVDKKYDILSKSWIELEIIDNYLLIQENVMEKYIQLIENKIIYIDFDNQLSGYYKIAEITINDSNIYKILIEKIFCEFSDYSGSFIIDYIPIDTKIKKCKCCVFNASFDLYIKQYWDMKIYNIIHKGCNFNTPYYDNCIFRKNYSGDFELNFCISETLNTILPIDILHKNIPLKESSKISLNLNLSHIYSTSCNFNDNIIYDKILNEEIYENPLGDYIQGVSDIEVIDQINSLNNHIVNSINKINYDSVCSRSDKIKTIKYTYSNNIKELPVLYFNKDGDILKLNSNFNRNNIDIPRLCVSENLKYNKLTITYLDYYQHNVFPQFISYFPIYFKDSYIIIDCVVPTYFTMEKDILVIERLQEVKIDISFYNYRLFLNNNEFNQQYIFNISTTYTLDQSDPSNCLFENSDVDFYRYFILDLENDFNLNKYFTINYKLNNNKVSNEEYIQGFSNPSTTQRSILLIPNLKVKDVQYKNIELSNISYNINVYCKYIDDIHKLNDVIKGDNLFFYENHRRVIKTKFEGGLGYHNSYGIWIENINCQKIEIINSDKDNIIHDYAVTDQYNRFILLDYKENKIKYIKDSIVFDYKNKKFFNKHTNTIITDYSVLLISNSKYIWKPSNWKTGDKFYFFINGSSPNNSLNDNLPFNIFNKIKYNNNNYDYAKSCYSKNIECKFTQKIIIDLDPIYYELFGKPNYNWKFMIDYIPRGCDKFDIIKHPAYKISETFVNGTSDNWYEFIKRDKNGLFLENDITYKRYIDINECISSINLHSPGSYTKLSERGHKYLISNNERIKKNCQDVKKNISYMNEHNGGFKIVFNIEYKLTETDKLVQRNLIPNERYGNESLSIFPTELHNTLQKFISDFHINSINNIKLNDQIIENCKKYYPSLYLFLPFMAFNKTTGYPNYHYQIFTSDNKFTAWVNGPGVFNYSFVKKNFI